MNYLQPYKGKSTRHTCPSCGRKYSFTLYFDGQTHEPINRKVGKCNREIKCGYHYTPKQYFINNSSFQKYSVQINPRKPFAQSHLERNGERLTSPSLNSQKVFFLSPNGESTRRGIEVREIGSEIPFHYLQNSLSAESNFVSFLKNYFSEEQIQKVFKNYLLGATKNKEVIFWQIDTTGKVRTGKIIQYNPETGKRIKHMSGAIDWVHNKLKKSGQLTEDFNLKQCFFGEHLLKIYSEKPVGIVESEKSAIIASCILPDMIWLAAGNLNGLSIEKCQILRDRNVILYPDLGAYEKWSEKAKMLNSPSLHGEGEGVRCSTLLENEANDTERANGLDIADFIIAELKQKKGEIEIQSYFCPLLQSMIEKNKTLLVLTYGLGLDVI